MENYSDSEIQIDILHKSDSFSSDSKKLSFMHYLSVFENEDTRETRKMFEPEIQFDFCEDIDHKPVAKNDENLKDGDNKANTFEMNEHLFELHKNVSENLEPNQENNELPFQNCTPVIFYGSSMDNNHTNNNQKILGLKRKGPKPKENRKSKYSRNHFKESGDNQRTKIFTYFRKFMNQNVGSLKNEPDKLNRELMSKFLKQPVFNVIENPNELTIEKLYNIFLESPMYFDLLKKTSSDPEYTNKLKKQAENFINFYSQKPRKKKGPNQKEQSS